MKSPQQAIYDALFEVSLSLKYRTFPFLPAKEASYPFVYVGEQYDTDKNTKSMIYGDVVTRLHIYHDYRKRSELTDMMDNLKSEIRKMKRAEGFALRIKRINSQTLLDTSTGDSLYHGIVEVEITFN